MVLIIAIVIIKYNEKDNVMYVVLYYIQNFEFYNFDF